jgi:hypothetical protein
MTIDLSGLETELLQALSIVLVSLATYGIKIIIAKLKISNNAAIIATLDDAASKAVNAAVVEADATIKAHGWDSVETKNAVLASAANQLLAHGQTALQAAGYDPSTAQGKQDIQDIVARALPKAAMQAAASPVTPPVANAA